MKNFLILILFISISQQVQSQVIYNLSLDSAIAIAKSKSFKINNLNETLKQTAFQLKSINAGFKPSISFNGNLPRYSEDMIQTTDSIGSYYSQKQSYTSGNIQISQVLPTDGKLYLTSSIVDNRNLNTSTKWFNVTSGIRFEQPLQALYAYNSMLAAYKRAKLNFELANKQSKREELDLKYDISNLFYAVVSAEREKDIAFQDLKRQEEAYKMAKNKFDAGLIKEVETLQIEVDLGEATNRFDIQSNNYQQRINILKQEMGISLKDSIVTENKLAFKPVLVNLQLAINMGMKYRPEIREKEIRISLSELEIKRQRAEGTIRGNISAYYNFIGANQYALDYNTFDAFDNSYSAMKNRRGNRGITLTLNIPILDWGENRNLVNLQKSRLKQNHLSLDYEAVSIENEIRNTVGSLNSSLRRLQLSEKTVKLAEKSYNISYERFTNGDIDAESLSLDRIRYNNAQQSHLNAYISYKLLLLDLTRKTFYDFENERLIE